MLIRDILTRNARLYPNNPAITVRDEIITYRELSVRVSRRAASLQAWGVEKGDRVAVLLRNSALYVELLYAVTHIGGVLLPLNHLLIGREIREILLEADARFLLYDEEFRETVERIRPSLQCISRFACFGGTEGEVAVGAPVAPAPVPLSETDVAIQIPVSEASGAPRGAMLSHRNLLSAAATAALELRLSRSDIYLYSTPLPFMSGTGRLLRFQYMGGAIVLLKDFDPEETLRAIERHRITHILLTPTMMARILDLPSAGKYNLATLRTVLYGGGSIPFGLQKRAITFFRCGMVQSYGHVESAGVMTFLGADDHSLQENAPYMRRLMSVGKEGIGVEVRVVDEGGNEMPADQVGELVARGPNIFEGYYRDPDSTAAILRDGWLHTGDIAAVDEEGYIYIVDRKRDTLSVGGIAVSPREIENILVTHPAVFEAAVVGRPDYTLGEAPAAIVALKEGEAVTADALLEHCRENLASFKVPQSIAFIPQLPRNSQGKVLKAKLREKMAGGSPPRTPRR